jgi:hypothetical protein
MADVVAMEKGWKSAAGNGMTSRKLVRAVIPSLISLIDFRMQAHGSEHTTKEALEASEKVLELTRVLVDNRVKAATARCKTTVGALIRANRR